MQNILTSWKEIGQYLGKGVRTVQRWESEYGLPVRRASSGSHRAVLAVPQEIDAWVQQQTKDRRSELECLRSEAQALREENAILRHQMAGTVAETQQSAQPREKRNADSAIAVDLLRQSSRRSHVSSRTQLAPERNSHEPGSQGPSLSVGS
jgi:predicted DNA-binding transcriptional regulator AlpA